MAISNSFVPITKSYSKPVNPMGLTKAVSGANMTNPANNPQAPAQQPPQQDPNKADQNNFTWSSTFGTNPSGAPYNYQAPYSFDANKQAPATQSWGVAAQPLGMPMPSFQNIYGSGGAESKWQSGPSYGQGEFGKQSFSSPITASNIGQNAGLYAPYMTQALDKLSNLGQGDFGLSQPIVEKMKVAEGQSINKGYDAQQERTKRMLHQMGIQDSSAALNEMQDIDMSRLGDLNKSYNNIDIENAKTANQQKLDTLNKLAGFGTQAAQLGEQGRQNDLTSLINQLKLGEDARQFNVTGLFDQSKLNNDFLKFGETAQYNRANLLNDVQEFLKNYDLEKLRMAQGLTGQNTSLLGNRKDVLPIEFSYGGY